MVVSDMDLVSRLMAMPPEARRELLRLLEDPLARSFEETEQAILARLAESARGAPKKP